MYIHTYIHTDISNIRVPTGSGKQGNVREKSGNFILGPKSGKSQGILFQNSDCHEILLLFLSTIAKVVTNMKVLM